MREDPNAQQWLVRAMVLRETGRRMAGHIGFHGPPVDGAAELGYTVFPEYRRRGYALEAATALMDWAQKTHGVRRFIVSVSPSNGPSLALAAKMGFAKTGEQMDEVDGLEYVFELRR
jgi:RimJ/RimL family protein N-acetyltransferase